jgi:hypothetical protein
MFSRLPSTYTHHGNKIGDLTYPIELPASGYLDILELHSPPVCNNIHELSGVVAHTEMSRHHQDHQYNLSDVDTTANQQYGPSQPLLWANTVSATPTSCTRTSLPYSNEASVVPQNTEWDDNAVIHSHATFSPLDSTYLIMPTNMHPQHTPDANTSVSTSSNHHECMVGDHHPFISPPTPPAGFPLHPVKASFSSVELRDNSFEWASSPPTSQVFTQRLSALFPKATFETAPIDAIDHMQTTARPFSWDFPISPTHSPIQPTENINSMQNAGGPSAWERRISPTHSPVLTNVAKLHMHNNSVSFLDDAHKTTSSYDDISTSPSRTSSINPSLAHFAPYSTTLDGTPPRPLTMDHASEEAFLPLECNECKATFNGKYQKGNLRQHVRRSHPNLTTSYPCRFCRRVYYRADAKRKHEWKKHKIEDCRPRKRRVEKTERVVESTINLSNESSRLERPYSAWWNTWVESLRNHFEQVERNRTSKIERP